MNVAFLLVTSAWLTGFDPVPAPPVAAPPGPVAPAIAPAPGFVPGPIAGGSCPGGNCGGTHGYEGCGCDNACCCKPSCLDRIRALFHHKKCNSCDTCSSCAPTCNTCAPTCNTCASSCDCCEPKCKHGLLARLRARFHHKKCDCCDTCNTCGDSHYGHGYAGPGGVISPAPGGVISPAPGGVIAPAPAGSYAPAPAGVIPAPVPAPPAGEPIAPPKDKPADKAADKLPLGDPKAGTTAPELTPTNSKSVETETKSPFELSRRYESRVDRAPDYSWITGQLFFVHADGGLWVLRYASLGQEDPNGGAVVLARNRQMDSYREGDLVKVRGDLLNMKGSSHLGAPLFRLQSIELIERKPAAE